MNGAVPGLLYVGQADAITTADRLALHDGYRWEARPWPDDRRFWTVNPVIGPDGARVPVTRRPTLTLVR